MRPIFHALAALVTVLFCAQPASAAPLLDLSGTISLADGEPPTGTSVTLQIDLDGNGKFAKFETLAAKVNADGAYVLRYELELSKIDLEFLAFVRRLLSDFNARGFDALLDRGPLPVMLTVELPGYSTITKRFSALIGRATFDAVLAPIAEINCAGDVCMTPGGSVRIEGFPIKTGIARAYAQAYDPTLNADRFPGAFRDDKNNLLVSSGFAEIDLFDDTGKPIHELLEPVAVRFAMDRESWPTLPDLDPNSGHIELPMYSFDRETGEWTREDDGQLESADGTPVAEGELQAIHEGRFRKDVFVAFRTKHFSFFNCDAPISERACVKGRLVDAEGTALAGISVTVNGSNYGGNGGTLLTSSSGYFASDVRRSEPENRDLDLNGTKGEVFRAHVRATGQSYFAAEPFETPSAPSSVFDLRGRCTPPQCECLDLGDIKVKFEQPRLCTMKFRVTFEGDEVAGSESGLADGAALTSARVIAALAGDEVPLTEARKLCGAEPCNTALTDAEGAVTLRVPVLGPAPRVQVLATFQTKRNGKAHYYSGALTLDGCTTEAAEIDGEVALSVSHTQLDGLAAFVAKLDAADADADELVFCDCRLAGGATRSFGPATSGLAGLALASWLRRRRKR